MGETAREWRDIRLTLSRYSYAALGGVSAQ